MNKVVIVTGRPGVIEELDQIFDVVTVTPNSRKVGTGNFEVLIMDSRLKRDIRTEIHNVYKRKTINTGT